MVSFSLTYFVLLLRKSKIQAMRFLFTERDKTFLTIICGWMVLNADEKSIKKNANKRFWIFHMFRAKTQGRRLLLLAWSYMQIVRGEVGVLLLFLAVSTPTAQIIS